MKPEITKSNYVPGPIDPTTQHVDGKWKKGCSGNPGGRPKTEKFNKLLRDLFGEDSKELVYVLVAQMYGVDIDHVGLDKINKILPEHLKKDFRNRKINMIDKRLQSDNVKWLIERMQGKVLQENKTEISTPESTDINIKFVKTKEDL